MSTGPRVVLGFVCLLIAIAFALLGPIAGAAGNEFAKGPLPFYGLAAFSGCIALACLVPKSRPITLRIIGAAVFVGSAVYLYQDLDKPNMLRALACFCVFGLPAGYVTVTGKYPRWGEAAAAFGKAPGAKSPRNREEEPAHTDVPQHYRPEA